MKDQIILTQTTKNELLKEFLEGVKILLEESRVEDLNSKEWLTSPEVQRLLKISSVTLYHYDKKGITEPHTLTGKRKRYKKNEILKLLKKKESAKAQRNS